MGVIYITCKRTYQEGLERIQVGFLLILSVRLSERVIDKVVCCRIRHKSYHCGDQTSVQSSNSLLLYYLSKRMPNAPVSSCVYCESVLHQMKPTTQIT